MKHTLKTDPAMFRAARDGRKNFEIRKDDRVYQAGDTIELTYYDPEEPTLPSWAAPAPALKDTHDDITTVLQFRITFVLRGGQYGLEPGYVGLALERLIDKQPVFNVEINSKEALIEYESNRYGGLSPKPAPDMHTANLSDQKFLEWIVDRLVFVYGDNPNVDFILKLRKFANSLA